MAFWAMSNAVEPSYLNFPTAFANSNYSIDHFSLHRSAEPENWFRPRLKRYVGMEFHFNPLNETRKGSSNELLKFITLDQLEQSLNYSNRIASRIPIWYYAFVICVGITLNSMNIVIFSKPDMKSPLTFMLSWLEGINMALYLLSIVPIAFNHYPSLWRDKLWCSSYLLTDSIFYSCVFLSNWLTVTVCIWRFIAVTWPFAARTMCTKRRAMYALIGLCIASAVTFMLMYLLLTLVDTKYEVFKDGNFTEHLFTTSIFSSDFNGITERGTTVLNIIILLEAFVPTITITIFTGLLVYKLLMSRYRRRRLSAASTTYMVDNGPPIKRNECEIAIALLPNLSAFIVAYIPDSLACAMMFLYPSFTSKGHFYIPHDAWIAKCILDVNASRICIINSNNLTFFIYFCMSENFRKTLFEILSPVRQAFFGKHSVIKDGSSRHTSSRTEQTHL